MPIWTHVLERDAGLTVALNDWSGHWPLLDSFMVTLSSYGLPVMVLAFAAFWWNRRDRIGERRLVLTAGVAELLALAFNQLILLCVTRARPYDAGLTHLLIAKSADPSFPSDHASVAFALAFVTLIMRRHPRGVLLLLAAAAIGLSRVYVGTHYVGDILGGIATAATGSSPAVWLYPKATKLDRIATGFL